MFHGMSPFLCAHFHRISGDFQTLHTPVLKSPMAFGTFPQTVTADFGKPTGQASVPAQTCSFLAIAPINHFPFTVEGNHSFSPYICCESGQRHTFRFRQRTWPHETLRSGCEQVALPFPETARVIEIEIHTVDIGLPEREILRSAIEIFQKFSSRRGYRTQTVYTKLYPVHIEAGNIVNSAVPSRADQFQHQRNGDVFSGMKSAHHKQNGRTISDLDIGNHPAFHALPKAPRLKCPRRIDPLQ